MQLYYSQMVMEATFSKSDKNITHICSGLRRPHVIKINQACQGPQHVAL